MYRSDALRDNRAAETIALFRGCGGILTDDHFVYISGDHGSGWIDKDIVFVEPQRTARLAVLLAEIVADVSARIVCGPATGGLVVAQALGYASRRQAVFAEHLGPRTAGELRGDFALRRGYDRIVAGQDVLVVDDVVNTGHSVRQTIAAVWRCGGRVTTAAALVDRGNVDAAGLDVTEYRFLARYDIPEWPAAGCPLCRAGVPVNTRYAHGQDFVDAQSRGG